MAILVYCLKIILVFALFRRCAEAASSIEMNRALIAFNRKYDLCKEVTANTHGESKTSADQECDRAFHALDQLKLNTCHGWRHAECRVVPGDENQNYQCTCLTSYCDDFSVRSSIITPFRYCAARLRQQEDGEVQALTPMPNFQQARSHYDEALDAADFRRSYTYYGWLSVDTPTGEITYHDGAGTPNGAIGAFNAGGAGSTNVGVGTFTSGWADSLVGAQAVLVEGSSWGMNASGYKDPSAAFPSYAPGSSSGAKAGKKSAAQPKIFTCDKCGSKLQSARALFDHKRIHHPVGDLHCNDCNKPFSSRKTFLVHLHKKHPNVNRYEVELRSAEAEALLPHACSFCPKRFALQSSLTRHKASHTTDDTKCRVCPKTFSTRKAFKYHMKTAHPATPIPEKAPTIREPGPGHLVCSFCGRRYVSQHGLDQHEKSHTTRDTNCLFCKTNYGSVEGYKYHMRTMHPRYYQLDAETTKPHGCGRCPKRFKNARGLQEHEEVHDGKTTCDVCNKVLPRKSNLVAHKKTEHK